MLVVLYVNVMLFGDTVPVVQLKFTVLVGNDVLNLVYVPALLS